MPDNSGDAPRVASTASAYPSIPGRPTTAFARRKRASSRGLASPSVPTR